MNRLNRRRFMALSSAGVASAVLVACGNEPVSDEDLSPTQIPDVAGAPPTLAPLTGTPESGGGDQDSGGEQSGGGGGSGTVEIEAFDIGYTPGELELAPGDTLVMNNTGVLQHDLVIEDFGDEEVIPLINGGESAEWTVPDDVEVGASVTFYCSVAGHREAGMEGTITFVEAGAAGASEEEGEEEEAAEGGGGSTEIEAFDIGYEPNELELAPGDTLTMTNTGVLEHDLIIEDMDDLEAIPLIPGGESAEWTVPDDVEVGSSVTFYCSVAGHREAGMEGTITFVEGGGGGAAEEEASPEEEAEGDEAAAAGATDEESGGGGGGEMAVEIEGFEMGFEPSEFTIAPGGTITMTNTGVLEHDFAVDDWGGVLIGPMAGGESGEYTVPEDAAPGETFEFYCSIPGHKESGMVGTLTVGEAGGGGGGAAADEGDAEATPEEEDEAAAGGASEGGEAGETAIELEAFEMAFEPAEFTIAPGGTITMTNTGVLEHDFAIDDWGGVLIGPINAGETAEYTVPEDAAPGESFEFYCSIPGHKESGMVGTLTVGGGDSAAASTGQDGEEEAATPDEASAASSSGGESVAEVSISAFEFGYDPAEVEVSPGTKVVMVNDGVLEHDIYVDAWGEIAPLVGGGSEAEGVIPDDAQSGDTFEFYCTVAGHRESGMVGTFVVVGGEGGGDATAEADGGEAEEEISGNKIEIAANEWTYSPSEVEVAPGDTIVLRNDGAMAHDMSSEEWGEPFIPDVAHGETGSFVVPEDAEIGSTIEIYSVNQGARNLGMTGTITIVEESEAVTAPSAPAATPQVSPEEAATPGAATPEASGGGSTIEVEAGDIYFEPAEFEASPGDTIVMNNVGVLEHDMASEALGVTMIELLSPGEMGEFVIPDDASGEIDIYCTVAGHKEAGMVGTITIV